MTDTPANQPDRAGERELDRILNDLRWYEPVTESSAAADDAVRRKIAEAKAAIAAYVEAEVRRALERLKYRPITPLYPLTEEETKFNQRIAELTAAPVGGQDGEGKG